MPPSATPPPRRRRRGLLVLLLVVVLVLAAAGVSGVFAVRAASHKYAKAPTQSQSVDLSALGATVKGATLAHWNARTPDGVEFLRMHGKDSEFVLAVDPGSSVTTPRWIAELPEGSGPCSLREQSLICGDAVIDAEKGTVTTTPGGKADTADDALRSIFGGSGKASDEKGTSPSDAGGQAPSDEGGATAPSDAGEDASPATASDASPSASRSTRLTDTTSGPYTVAEDGSLAVGEGASGHGADTGDSVADLTFEADAPVWAIPVETPRSLAGLDLPLTEDLWVVSDGTHLAGLSGGDVLWQQDLDEDSAALTGLGAEDAPRWYALPGVVLVAGPDAIRAVDARTGEDRWQIDAPDGGTIDSWTTDGTRLWLQSGDAVGMVDLTHPADDQDTPVPGLPTGEDWKADLPEAPSLKDLKDGKLEIPGGCANFGLHYDETYIDGDKDPEPTPDTAGFTGGTATAKGGDTPAAGSVTLRDEATTTIVDGTPVTVVAMDCFGGGSYSYGALAYYGPEKKLVASLDPLDDRTPQLQGTIQEQRFDDVTPVGRTLRATVPQVQLVGDTGCHACEGTTTADVLYQLGDPKQGGDDVTLLDAVYDTPSGPVRTPDPDRLQKALDAFVDGDEDAIARVSTSDAVFPPFADDPGMTAEGAKELPTRAEMFPKDTTLGQCELIGPVEEMFDDYYMGGGRDSATLTYGASPLADASPGDTVCGITSKDAEWAGNFDDKNYGVYMIVAGDEHGQGKIRTINYTFG